MKFELIVIGNVLLNGKIQDLNTAFLAQELYERNHQLEQVHIIGDKEEQFLATMEAAWQRSDVVITCGGLGPTKDDLTKNMLAKFFHKQINYSELAHQITLEHYNRGNRTYNQAKIDYHNFPDDFIPLKNAVGYAPGLHYQEEDKFVFALPGVPAELQAMLSDEVFPKLPNNESQLIKHVIVKTWKVPEATIFHTLCPDLWENLERYGEVSSLPHSFGVDIGVKLIENSQAEIDKKEKEILDIIQATELKDSIWNIGPESLEEVIVKIANEKNLTIGFSESCTGGLCASRITNISGSSAVFWGSVVSYANEVKMKSLAVSEKTLIDHGAVSEQTAFEMAKGAKEHLAVDIAVSTTGIAGPGGGSTEKPVGTVGIGVSSSNGTSAKIYHFRGNRLMLKKRFSEFALVTMLEELFKVN